MTVAKCELIGVRVVTPVFEQKQKATLAEIKKVIQPMLSKWAAMTDLAIQRERWDNGEYDKEIWPRPKRGAKNWVSLRSDRLRHAFEIGTQNSGANDPHNIALKKYTLFLEQFIEQQFDQKVPVEIGTIPTYTVTSGESSSTVFRGEEQTGELDDWF